MSTLGCSENARHPSQAARQRGRHTRHRGRQTHAEGQMAPRTSTHPHTHTPTATHTASHTQGHTHRGIVRFDQVTIDSPSAADEEQDEEIEITIKDKQSGALPQATAREMRNGLFSVRHTGNRQTAIARTHTQQQQQQQQQQQRSGGAVSAPDCERRPRRHPVLHPAPPDHRRQHRPVYCAVCGKTGRPLCPVNCMGHLYGTLVLQSAWVYWGNSLRNAAQPMTDSNRSAGAGGLLLKVLLLGLFFGALGVFRQFSRAGTTAVDQ